MALFPTPKGIYSMFLERLLQDTVYMQVSVGIIVGVNDQTEMTEPMLTLDVQLQQLTANSISLQSKEKNRSVY